MNYVEWVSNQNELFAELNSLDQDGLFEALGVENLNFMYVIKYGNRQMINKLSNKTTKEVAKLLYSLYSSKWHGLYNLTVNNTNPIGFESMTIIEETNTDQTTKNLTTTQISKNSAFNEDDLFESAENDDTINETGNKAMNKQYTQTKTSAVSIDKEREMLENGYIINEVICDDISKMISLCIY